MAGSVFVVDDNFVGNRQAIKALLPRITDWMGSRGNPFSLFTQASINLAEDDELLSLMRAARFNKVFIGDRNPFRGMQPGGGQDAEREGRSIGVRATHPGARNGSDGRFHRRLRSGSPEIFEKQIDFIRRRPSPSPWSAS